MPCITIDVFTTLPTTQYVWINQTATFTCATNVTGYSLSFSIPGELELYLDTQNPSEGGTLAAVSFTVTSDNNGTSVSCIADDGVNAPEFTALVFAYAQGKFSQGIIFTNLTIVCIIFLPLQMILTTQQYHNSTVSALLRYRY